MTAPTKETHRYVGMWRPPFETLVENWIATAGPQGPAVVCKCGDSLFDYDSRTGNIGYKRKEAMDYWLAGHFDEPIYEPLASSVVESFRRMPPIDVSQTFPVDETAPKGKVIINERALEDSD